MRKGYRVPEDPTLSRRGARRSAARAAMARLRAASDALDESVAGAALGAVSLVVAMICLWWLAYGVFG